MTAALGLQLTHDFQIEQNTFTGTGVESYNEGV